MTGALAARRGAVITGPAGVGKTTLALSGVKWAEQRGIAHRRASATRASQGLPFGAFASLLPPERRGAESEREDLGVLLGRYTRAMVEEAQGLPLMVFVDDAHLLDMGSALLMHQMALTRAATVLATVRAGEALPDPVLSMWKDGPAERIEIGVLDDETIEELLASALGAPVDVAVVQELAARSRGNPMFLRELVSGALETGALVDVGGLWRLEGALSPTVRLVELVALRLGELSQSERSVLELLALGEPLGPTELEQLADRPAVDALEATGLITERDAGRPDRDPPSPPRLRGRGARRHQRTQRTGHFALAGRGDRGRRCPAPGRPLEGGDVAARGRRRQRRAAGLGGDGGPGPPRVLPHRTPGPGRHRGRRRVRGPFRGGRGRSFARSLRPGRTGASRAGRPRNQ